MTGQSRDNGDQRPPRALVSVLTFDNMIYLIVMGELAPKCIYSLSILEGGQRKLSLDQRDRIGVILNYFLIFFVC